MTKVNAKAEAPSNEQLMELILKLNAEKEALASENKKLKASAPQAGISLSDKGGINVMVPAGKGSVAFHFYIWQWNKISSMRDQVDAFAKKNADKFTTEEAFRAAKAK